MTLDSPRDQPSFGELLRGHRRSREWTQEMLAERAGVSSRSVSDLERGARTHPYRETATQLADALELTGSERAALLAAARRPLPPVGLTGHASRDTHLPIPRTPLIGREREVVVLIDVLCRDEVQLLTLTGPGGVGKTRLALQIAANTSEAFPDGVWFVDLSPIIDVDLVVPAIAQVVGVRDAGDARLSERLKTFLRDRHLLLVLDNAEQVVAAGSFVSDLLQTCRTVTVLATSRVRFHLSSEREHVVLPLEVGTPATSTMVPGGLQPEAVRLFVQRAQSVNEDFTLTVENIPVILDICSRLDGLPLAIELAAARSKVLPPSALLARLQQRLPLLTGGPRDAPTRQQTMRDAIAWSYDLLPPDEQALFRTLSVFVGGFDLKAAAVVAGQAEIAVLDRIASLIDKSQLRPELGPGGEPRYSMLETMREFGLEQLAGHGEESQARHAHAAYFLALGERAAAHGEMQFGRTRYWIDRLEVDHANLRNALTYFADAGEPTAELRLAAALALFWFQNGSIREGIDRLEGALARATSGPAGLRAQVLAWLALLYWVAGESARGLELCIASEDLASEARDPVGVGLALYFRSLAVGWNSADPLQGVPYAEHALVLAKERTPMPWFVPFALGDMGQMLTLAGQPERGIPLVEEALALHHALGQDFGVGMKLLMLGLTAQQAGDPEVAAERYREGLALLWSVGHATNVHLAMAGLAGIAADHGYMEPAARLLGMVEAVRERTGAPVHAPWQPVQKRATNAARSTLGHGLFTEVMAAGQRLPVAEAVAEALALAKRLVVPGVPPDLPSAAAGYGLSPREVEILRLLVAGQSNTEIAEALFISRRTVTTHVSHLYAKLGVASRAEAIAHAHAHALL